jgi:hypothetical protein
MNFIFTKKIHMNFQKLFFFFIVLFGFSSLNAQQEVLKGYELDTMHKVVHGTIKKIGDVYVIDVNDMKINLQSTYMPENLKAPFKVEGMKVIFGCFVGKPPIFARMIGTPIHITYMKKDMPITPKKKVKK